MKKKYSHKKQKPSKKHYASDPVKAKKHLGQHFLNDEKIGGVLINFQEVKIIDSTGVATIISAFKSLEKRKAKLALCESAKTNVP